MATGLVVVGLVGTGGLTDVVVTADGDVTTVEPGKVLEVLRGPTGRGRDVDRRVGDVGADGSGRDRAGEGGEGNNGLGEHFVDFVGFCWLVGG